MKVTHVIGSLERSRGGPASVVLGLIEAQLDRGHSVRLIVETEHAQQATIQGQLGKLSRNPALEVVGAKTQKDIAEALSGSDVLHLHGVWCSLVRKAAGAARSLSIPYVQAPHGALSPFAMSQKRWKKRIALEALIRRSINRAAFIHANNLQEAQDLESLGLRAPIEVIPHGLSTDELTADVSPHLFRERYLRGSTRPFVLFLGRLAYQKAPELLVRAFPLFAEALAEVDLVIAGPDYGQRSATDLEIAQLSRELQGRIHLVGPLYGEDKLSAMTGASLFCAPSRFESFGVVLIEALARGCPVIYSDQCFFPLIAREGAGIEFQLGVDDLAKAIITAWTTEGWRDKAALNGRRLVAARYSWASIATDLDRQYLVHSTAGRSAVASR